MNGLLEDKYINEMNILRDEREFEEEGRKLNKIRIIFFFWFLDLMLKNETLR